MRFLQKLWQCAWVWEVPPATGHELASAQAIFAFADSRMRDGSPGHGNELITRTVLELQRQYHLPALVQDEVELAARHLRFNLDLAYVARGPQHGKSSREWNTAAITREFQKVCNKKGWRRIVVATTPDHMARCIWVAKRQGFNAAAAEMPEGNYFHPDLALWACRGGQLRFRLRDFLVRVFFLFKGHI